MRGTRLGRTVPQTVREVLDNGAIVTDVGRRVDVALHTVHDGPRRCATDALADPIGLLPNDAESPVDIRA